MANPYSMIIFCSLVTSMVHAAQAPCSVCEQYLPRNPLELPSSVNGAYQDTREITYNAIVLAKLDTMQWEKAIVLRPPTTYNENVNLHLCESHNTVEVNYHALHPYTRFLQLDRQNPPSREWTKKLLQSYLNRYGEQSTRIISMIVSPTTKIAGIGDLHGYLPSLQTIIGKMVDKNMMNDALELAPDHYITTMGDYSDRQSESVEIWHYLMLLKLLNTRVMQLQGNHETIAVAKRYGFLREWYMKLGQAAESHLGLVRLFACLPQALLVGFRHAEPPYYRFLLFMHGGIAPQAPILQIMQNAAEKHMLQQTLPAVDATPLCISSISVQHYIWNDFSANEPNEKQPIVRHSARGGGALVYNTSAAQEYILDQHVDKPKEVSCRLDGIVCAHAHHHTGLGILKDHIEAGYDWETILPGHPHHITPGEVLTCNSSFESSYSEPSLAAGTFAIFSPTEHGTWQVEAC